MKNILKLFNISHFASIDRVDLVYLSTTLQYVKLNPLGKAASGECLCVILCMNEIMLSPLLQSPAAAVLPD